MAEVQCRKSILVTVTEDFKDIDMEFQRICKTYGINQSAAIRQAIRAYVKYMNENSMVPFSKR